MFSQQQQQSQLGGATSGGGLFSQQQKLGGGLFNTPGQTKLGGLNTGLVGTTGGGLFSQQQTSQPGGLFNQPSGGLFNQSSTGVGGLGALGQQQTQVCVSIIMCVLFSNVLLSFHSSEEVEHCFVLHSIRRGDLVVALEDCPG